MLSVKDVPGVSVFAALYGFFSGACECATIICHPCLDIEFLDVTLLAPMLALLADHPSEIG